MRSFVYLPLISTIVSLAFAMQIQQENTPDLAASMTPEVIVAIAPGSGQISPRRHGVDSSASESLLPADSSKRKSRYGYLCQTTLYRLQHLQKTARHACHYIMTKKQTNGRVKYPMKLNVDNQPNSQYLFPVLPENKFFTGGYFNFGLRLSHFLVIDHACERAKVTYRFWEDPHKSTKNWCSWPKCFFNGNSQYLDCPALYKRPDPSKPEYFLIHFN